MAQPKTLWEKCNNDSYIIFNQGPVRYSTATWERLKNFRTPPYSDQELAEVLNNFKP